MFAFKSTATPTDEELAAFGKHSRDEQLLVLDSELDKGLTSGVSERTVEDILNEVKSRYRKRAS